jgi:hypothetical protein
VFDHTNRIAYACLSERTDRGMLYELDELLGYRSVAFHATDAAGVAVYHTNVVMSIGQSFVVVCAEAIDDEGEREHVIGRLEATDRELIRLGRSQMASFAANVLELRGGDGQSVLAVSEHAWGALTVAQRVQLENRAGVVTVPIPTIESVGGGSIRCMIAEIFLPRARA